MLRKVREKVKIINEVEMRFNEKNISHYCIAPLSDSNAQMMLSGHVNLKIPPPVRGKSKLINNYLRNTPFGTVNTAPLVSLCLIRSKKEITKIHKL